jgi:predicted histidine transporter YuiF (NhaC family)
MRVMDLVIGMLLFADVSMVLIVIAGILQYVKDRKYTKRIQKERRINFNNIKKINKW